VTKPIPDYPIDIFTHASVRDARAVDDALREFSPVVRLPDGTLMMARHAEVFAGLRDWQSFSSTSRPWHDPNSVRPEILLTDDPPAHTRARTVMANVLSPKTLDAMAVAFARDAAVLVDALTERSGEVIDVVAEITQRFVYKVLPDAVGLRVEGREHMHAFSHMVWATMGPENALYHEAMVGVEPVLAWLDRCCDRDQLEPGGLGTLLYQAADAGRITEAEAKLLLQTVLAAGADTTVLTMANLMRAFAEFPEEYARVRAAPELVRNAFDESLRWDSPSRMAGRITTREIAVEDHLIPAGERIGLMFAAANRDPRVWTEPDRFDVGRDLRGNVGWGYGVHTCVGRTLAQLEASALFGQIIRRIERFEPAGEAEPWMTTIGHGPARLPLRLHAA
jgi:cytochrome P450